MEKLKEKNLTFHYFCSSFLETMKKIFLFITVLLFANHCLAEEFTVQGNYYRYEDKENNMTIFLFDGIDLSLSIVCENATKWLEWDGTEKAAQKELTSFDEGGYKAIVDGKEVCIWIFDYKNYEITIDALQPLWFDEDKCSALKLQVAFSDFFQEMNYQTPTGETKTLKRNFTLTYKTTNWNGNSWSEPVDTIVKVKKTNLAGNDYLILDNQNEITLPLSPYCDTYFELSADKDEFAKHFGRESTKKSDLFSAIAIAAYPKGKIARRDADNELDKSSVSSTGNGNSKNCKCKEMAQKVTSASGTIGGSAPLVIDFQSNANPDAADFFEWFIYDVQTPSKVIRYTDKDFRYTFNDAGEYVVKLKASSAECEVTDSIKVTVLESFIDVPNVFTPNGDGINDEFRVVYRSIISFNAWVYNRWGRLVCRWTDPSKGWDGRINGKMAAPGAYYYVIEAIGSDKDKNGESIKWKCSGDINLLRGKR